MFNQDGRPGDGQRSAQNFHHHHGGAFRGDPIFLLQKIGFGRGIKVADLGSGDGFYTIPISQMVGPEGKVYAVDLNSQALSVLRDNIQTSPNAPNNIETVTADMANTGIETRSIDVVFLANSFHNARNSDALIKEIVRLLKPGGRVVDIDWMKKQTPFGPPYSIRFNEAEVTELFRKAGFVVEEQFHPDQYHYCLTFRLDPSNQEIRTEGSGKVNRSLGEAGPHQHIVY